MATINFYLDKPDSKGKCPIFLVCQHKGRKFRQYTSEKLLPKYWDTKKQKAVKLPGAGEINDHLEELHEKIKGVERTLRRTNPKFTFDDLKYAYKQDEPLKLNLFDFLDHFILEVEDSRKKKSIKEYRTIYNDLKGYEEYYKTTLSFDRINDSFLNKYLAFLVKVKENTQNTIAKKISTLKTLLNYGIRGKHHNNLAFKEFKVKKIETQKVYLEKKELSLIYNLDLSDNLKLEKVRDVFCFGCFTGLRYGDIRKLKHAEIFTKQKEDGTITKEYKSYAQKTSTPNVVPLNDYAIKILDKYAPKKEDSPTLSQTEIEKLNLQKYALPVISNQKMNDYIKDVAKLAKVNSKVIVTRFMGSKRTDETFEKHQLIATHAARRTFSILSLEQGMRIEVLQKILGHRSIRTTMKYVFILDDVKQKEMERAWGDFKL